MGVDGNVNLESNEVAYLSRLLRERYHVLDGVLTHARLDNEHRKESITEQKVIKRIQAKFHDNQTV